MAPLTVGLVNLPCITARRSLSYFEGAPPLGLAYVAGATRNAGHRPVVVDALGGAVHRYTSLRSSNGDLLLQGYGVDDIVERLPAHVDVVGIGNLFLHELRFLQQLVAGIRSRFRHVPIFLGGENASGMWEDLLRMMPEVTGCVLGEGEEAFCRLLDALEKNEGLQRVPSLGYRVDGSLHKTARANRIRAIDRIPWPAWDLFPVEQYLEAGIMSGVNRGRSLPVLTSRGCPFTCAFCSASDMWGTTYISRSPGLLLDEIQFLMQEYCVTNFDFRDLTAALTKKWIRAFHTEVKARKLRFTWQIPQGTRSESLDREALQLMYESGCRNFGYALESTSPHVIERMRKKVVPTRLMTSAREALRLPLRLEVFFVIGYPTETYADHWAYLRTIVRLAWMGVHSMSPIPFNPYPGSEDYRRFRDEGKIILNDAYIHSSLFRSTGQSAGTYAGFSNRYLVAFEFFCLLVFYTVQFVIRPWRPVRLAWNLLRLREETIFEQFLGVKMRQFLRRWRKRDRPLRLGVEESISRLSVCAVLWS